MHDELVYVEKICMLNSFVGRTTTLRNLNQIEMLQKFLILNFLHNKSFRHMIRATAIGYISRVLADQAQPLWVINPESQNCEFYVHVVSLLLFSIVLFFVRDFFSF